MIEFLKHLFGFCGEPHPSLITLLSSMPIVGYALLVLKNKHNKK